MNLKSITLIIALILTILPTHGENQQDNPQTDPTVLRFIQQEELKTRSEIKAWMTEQLKTDRKETQKIINENKIIIYKELNGIIRKVIFRIGIIWFVATLTALICYRFILIAIRRKFIRKGLRDEYHG